MFAFVFRKTRHQPNTAVRSPTKITSRAIIMGSANLRAVP